MPVRQIIRRFILDRNTDFILEKGHHSGEDTIDQPFKSSDLTSEQLKEYAKQLAHLHETESRNDRYYSAMLQNLKRNKTILDNTHITFTKALQDNKNLLPPSTEWLLDNYYIVEDQIASVKYDLTPGFYRDLPKLKSGPLRGFPRIYAIALELLTHSDNRLSKSLSEEFILAYESVSPITSAELWAFPIMLRLVLIENLKRVMEKSEKTFHKRKTAKIWSEKLEKLKRNFSDQIPTDPESTFNDKNPDPLFLVWVLRNLRDKDSSITPIIHWLEQYIEQEDINLEEIVKVENQRQAAHRVLTGNIITSMRLISSLDWSLFFESTSLVEKIFHQDPANIYTQMDFSTRDSYRHCVENISRFCRYNEQEVARRAIKLAAGGTGKRRHLGYYLIDKGLKELKKDCAYLPNLTIRTKEFIGEYPTFFYLTGISMFTGLGLYWVSVFFNSLGLPGFLAWASLIPVSVPAISLINNLVTHLFPPVTPPKLELKNGIPDDCATVVVVPCLIGSENDIRELVTKQEKRYLANRDKNIMFALLTDLPDSPNQDMPYDYHLLEKAKSEIQELNTRHREEGVSPFYLFHRARVYNAREKVWMGWERKRGKLEEFNRYLTGNTDTSFIITQGDLARIKTAKYVITLDADTLIPLNTAKKMIGAMAHPLNRPVIDEDKNIVVEGYGIIQPKVDIFAPSAAKTEFTRIFSPESGLDPYHSVVSNVYQDLFHNASYIGKAIYDLAAFNRCLTGRFPDNRLLSHDLLEGNYLRVGLATDIELLEDFPVSYDSYSRRQHRWIRGDWQTISWIFPWVKTAAGKYVRNSSGWLERWKIIDNLRRSLVIPSGTLLVIWGLLAFPSFAVVWTSAVLAAVFFPLVFAYFSGFTANSVRSGLLNYLTNVWGDIRLNTARLIISVSFMAYETFRNLNAVFLAGFRLIFKTQGILEWTSHSVTDLRQSRELLGYAKRMSLSIGFGLLLCFIWITPDNLYSIPTVVTLLWIISPVIAFLLSRPVERKIQTLSLDEKSQLAVKARKIWRFFDELADETNHFLPPDNLQISPGPKVAQRTSPTNIGFLLLSTLSAYDFGFIGKRDLLVRLERIFSTLEKMDKYNGHFYNWYQTDTLQTMHPAYISTVDSGNLASSLIVTKQACLEMLDSRNDQMLKTALCTTLKAWQEEWHLLNKKSTPSPLVTVSDTAGRANEKKTWEKVGEIIAAAEKIISDAVKRIEMTDIKNINKEISKLNILEKDIKYLESRLGKFADEASTRNLKYYRNQLITFTTRKKEQVVDSTRWVDLAKRAEKMVTGMDFKFLFDTSRKVFSIGFNADANILDESFYNLLASEARLASFMAIALGQIPEKHWFDLGRPVKKIRGQPVLLSWGGTVFEYLMPELFIRNYENTLIPQTNYGVLDSQINYAKKKGIPWGISESGFFAFDFDYNYQYQQFGVPDLSLKMVSSDNLVVAPYASLLALSFRPKEVFANLKKLEELGAGGIYGYFEAVDFNPDRIKAHDKYEVIQTYMSHHQGMGLVAINNYLNQQVMQSRFHRDELVATVELLLSERVPQHITNVVRSKTEIPFLTREPVSVKVHPPKFSGRTKTVKTTVLSNSEYTVVVANSGTGYSSFKNMDITRWQIDMVENNWGWFCFVKDSYSKEIWSTSYQPYLKKPDSYFVSFLPYKAEFHRVDKKIETKTTVIVAPDVNVEIREVSLTNKGTKVRKFEITDYAEVVGLKHRDDAFHPALGKLFMESEYDSGRQALLFKRRIKREDQPQLWIWHTLKTGKEKASVYEYETDRANFVGRGKTILDAKAFDQPLENFSGASLDPIMSLRTKITVKPAETIRLFFLTGVTGSKQEALALIDKYSEPGAVERTSKLAEIHSHIELRHLGIKSDEASEFQKLGSRIIYPDRYSRASQDILARNVKGQAGLYPYGISGDYPIVLVKIKSKDGLKLIRQTLLAHEFLRMKNIHFDLVILKEQKVTYSGDLKEAIHGLIDTSLSRPLVDKPGGIYLRDTALITTGDEILLQTMARIVIDSQFVNLEDAFDITPRADHKLKDYEYQRPPVTERAAEIKSSYSGGFSPAGNEYIAHSASGGLPPNPWSNIISNPRFGTLLTSGGLGYTWAENSQLNRLTTWSNDPVTEKPGEVVYIRDSQENGWWSASPLPVNNPARYSVVHGWGYSGYQAKTKNLLLKTDVWVDADDPVKIISLNITNTGNTTRKVKPLYYAELVMGDNREQNQFFVISEFDPKTGAVIARNSYNDLYAQNITFAVTSEQVPQYSADRMEFLGRGGSWSRPAYLEGHFDTALSQKTGAGLDPAVVFETPIALTPGQTKQITFILGQAKTHAEYLNLATKYRDPVEVSKSLKNTREYWKKKLSIIQIRTPNANLDTLANGWLIYQALSGRFWGRTSFFQSGGAFGFRDQLQDLLALMYSHPELVRAHILYTAGHQFIQGDVMHWWHPDTTRGVRTKISDDFLWLPYITAQYVQKTKDTGILDETVSFMDMAPLEKHEIERYDSAVRTQEKASVYDHCIRALENGMKTGKHGLPLIGSGDWNDGLNSVGENGIGESVWLGWFQYAVYTDFSRICKDQADAHSALRYQRYARTLKDSIEKHGWDGNWFRRAYFDDGSILGSKDDDEAMIDSVSQTWSVISSADTGPRAHTAIRSAEEKLVKEKEGLVLLLTPPFEKSLPFPGYIRGYVPGIRENGSQYTHAAVWLPLAYALLGNGSRAVQLLDMLNPINHTDTPEKTDVYKGEPYVLSGDVYSHPQHVGRAGWSWYTGSAAWMYKIIIEDILGLKQNGTALSFNPCVPDSWTGFEMNYLWKETPYRIKFQNKAHVSTGVKLLKLDSKTLKKNHIRLVNDKARHLVEVIMDKQSRI